MRIAQLLHQAYHKQNDEFIRALFRQILHREADEISVADHLRLMASGTAKNDIIIGIINCNEANQIYSGASIRLGIPTVAVKLRQLLVLRSEDLVHHLYEELLCRTPDSEGYHGNLHYLRQGRQPMDLVNLFLQSEEWLQLIQGDRNIMARKILFEYLNKLYH